MYIYKYITTSILYHNPIIWYTHIYNVLHYCTSPSSKILSYLSCPPFPMPPMLFTTCAYSFQRNISLILLLGILVCILLRDEYVHEYGVTTSMRFTYLRFDRISLLLNTSCSTYRYYQVSFQMNSF